MPVPVESLRGAPPPAPPGWYQTPQPRPRSHTGRWVALGVLGAICALAALLYVAVIQPDIAKKNDSKAALSDAKVLVDRSYPLSRAATRDTMRAANSPALAQRVERRLDRVILLRRRAISQLAPIEPLPLGDDRFDKAAAAWTAELRTSIRAARDLQYVLQQAHEVPVTPYLAISMGAIRDSRDALVASDARLKSIERTRIRPRL